jgi:DNA-binding response OmpR family regulator
LHRVATAHEALRLARSAAVDLWVISAELSDMSGSELCSLLKSRTPQAPVYLVADEPSVELERAAWHSRASMFGCKPAHAEWFSHWLAHERKREATAGSGPRAECAAAAN